MSEEIVFSYYEIVEDLKSKVDDFIYIHDTPESDPEAEKTLKSVVDLLADAIRLIEAE